LPTERLADPDRRGAPKVLAVLREELPSAVRKFVVAEIGKDLTQRSVYEIERHRT
jgi:protein required for attachment to host cells